MCERVLFTKMLSVFPNKFSASADTVSKIRVECLRLKAA